jgi:hypothetical protein
MIPALKHAVAYWSGDPGWAKVRPPLVELNCRAVRGAHRRSRGARILDAGIERGLTRSIAWRPLAH